MTDYKLEIGGFIQIDQLYCNICQKPQKRIHKKCKESYEKHD